MQKLIYKIGKSVEEEHLRLDFLDGRLQTVEERINLGLGACLKTCISVKSRHSRESGNPVFSMPSGSPGQAGG